ncbi:MAG: hypothetical protein V1720_04645 [bacterium]
MKFKSIMLIIYFFVSSLLAQQLTNDAAERFINSLINDDVNLTNFINSETLALSNRLGIEYDGIKNKFMLSYDIEPDIKKELLTGKLHYEISTYDTCDGYSLLTFSAPSKNYVRKYIFKDDKFVSPILFFTKDWTTIESNHYKFLVSDTTLLNNYCIENLEKFYLQISKQMKFPVEDETGIASHKIFYILCKNEEEIQKLTGYYAKGMYNLAYDCIITTYNAHYHELLHLLINYKLKNLQLYTHPFFQEGFAVAFGGRGGYEPEVILNLGVFLEKSGFMKYNELLTTDSFNKNDASMTYPLSGLYNKFLINEIGVEKYLELYRKYSGDYNFVRTLTVAMSDLLPIEKWNDFIIKISGESAIGFNGAAQQKELIISTNSARIFADSNNFFFEIKDTFFLFGNKMIPHFQSTKFVEIFVGRKYNGAMYFINVSGDDISIYNLYTNNLIANYVKSFAVPQKDVPQTNGYFRFSVPKELFENVNWYAETSSIY